jgi:preprotein translocase subunit SecA
MAGESNRLLNSFFMVSGTNSALVNPSTNKQAYRTKRLGHLDEADTGWKEYIATLQRLRDEARGRACPERRPKGATSSS